MFTQLTGENLTPRPVSHAVEGGCPRPSGCRIVVPCCQTRLSWAFQNCGPPATSTGQAGGMPHLRRCHRALIEKVPFVTLPDSAQRRSIALVREVLTPGAERLRRGAPPPGVQALAQRHEIPWPGGRTAVRYFAVGPPSAPVRAAAAAVAPALSAIAWLGCSPAMNSR